MKILQIGKFYPIRGGVEKVMYDLMVGLSQQQVYCDMLCASTENHPPGTMVINDYAKLIIVPTQIKLAATMLAPKMITTLRRIVNNYDVVHIHHPDPMATLALFLSGYKGKVLLHWHSDILKQKNLLRLYKPLQSWLINRADKIVGTTPVYVQESEFLQHVKHKIDYIPIGIDPVEVPAGKVNQIRQEYAGKKIVFSLGRLVEYKGYEYLIRAAAQLSDDYVILIGGTGPLGNDLRALVDLLKVSHKVKFLGYVADEDVPAYFQSCTMFCLSSILKTEAFAIVQIEAMAYHKPVVCMHIPGSGVSWVNEDNISGLVVEQRNSNALAKAITRIGENEALRKKLQSGAFERYKSYFNTAVMIRKAIHIYEILN